MDNLTEDQGDTNGPDFQKASCTLDASVKIYSYRVDDVWTSSFRVLENLNRTERPSKTVGELSFLPQLLS